MSNPSRSEIHSNSLLLWTTTPVERAFPTTMTAAVSSNGGILVYEDAGGDVCQIVDAEFKASPYIPVVARKFLTSGTITKGAGTGDSVNATATNVRAFW